MLSVLGAGLSRTGTFSLKRALEVLGFGPCYHMDEVFRRPEHVPLWLSASMRPPDWTTLFDGYRSAVDAPACHYWQSILAAHPRAKVVLTVRDPDVWYASFRATVYEAMRRPERLPVPARAPLDMARSVVLDGFFAGRFEDRAHAIATYDAHCRDVVAAVDPARLLVYRIEEGWRPLCDFLSVPVPSQDFPATNERSEFRRRLGLP